MTTTPPLSEYVVVDLSSGIAGAYCTKLLADGGAQVIKVEAPEGDPLRTWSASGAAIPEGDDGALFSFLSSSKQSVIADPDGDLTPVHDLLRGADAVVWSRGSRLAELPALSPDAIRRAAPHLTVTTITPFGLDGPWSERAATEFTLQAWSGAIVGLGRGAPDRAPVFVGGQIGEWLTGTYAAIGTMVSLGRSERATGELVDVSILETLALVADLLPRDLRRHGGTTVPHGPIHRDPGSGGDQRRIGRRRGRDRSAVARLLRDRRPSRVDGGPEAVRQPWPPATRDRGLDGRPHDRGGARHRPHVADPPRPPRQRRLDSVDRPLRGPPIDRHQPA